MGGVQNAESVLLRLHREGGIGDAVHHRGVHEGFGSPGGVGRSRHLRGLRRVRSVERVRHRAVFDAERFHRIRRGSAYGRGRPEPGAVDPAPHGVHAAEVGVVRILRRHVDVGPPEIARHRRRDLARRGVPRSRTPVPRGVRSRRADDGGRVHEGLVLNDDGNAVAVDGRHGTAGDGPRRDEGLLLGVGDQVSRRHARVDVKSRYAPGMVVVEEQSRALLVGVVVGLRPGTGVVRRVRRRADREAGACRNRRVVVAGVEPHVGDIHDARARLERRRIQGWRDPLVGRSVADPGRPAAVEMEVGAVFREAQRRRRLVGFARAYDVVGLGPRCVWPRPRPHDRRVDGEEELAGGVRGQLVDELDPDRPVLRGHDHGSQIADPRRGHVVGRTARVRAVIDLHVAAETRGAHFRMHDLAVFLQLDLVVIGSGIGQFVRYGKRNRLSRRGAVRRIPQARQGVLELRQQRAVGPVRGCAEVIRRLAGSRHRFRNARPPGEHGRCAQETDAQQ